MQLLLSVTKLLDQDDRIGRQELASDRYRRAEIAAGVIAEIEDDPAHTLAPGRDAAQR